MRRSEIVSSLRSFEVASVIARYRERDLAGKSPHEILNFSVDRTIYRAFHHETPSRRYRGWRWCNDPEGLLERLNGIESQQGFDNLALQTAESLVSDWGVMNELGQPSRMNTGIARKMTNLVLKHLTFSEHSHNHSLVRWLHVPWDSYTLGPLCGIWQGNPPMPSSPSQGFVKNLATYQGLHLLISSIAEDAGVPRIFYEFWAWDAEHQ